MNAYYLDIRSRIKEEPKWHDCHGVPRYDVFHPGLSPNIYAEEVVLLEISCQDCHTRFLVEMNWSVMEQIFNRHSESFSSVMRNWLKEEDKGHFPPVHYGDPPGHGCVGDTENCYDLRIVQFWKRGNTHDWKRITEYEVELEKEEK
jgi:hypothetical protein